MTLASTASVGYSGGVGGSGRVFVCLVVDDALLLSKASAREQILDYLNSWHASVVWLESASGSQVPFLDLSLSIVDNETSYETYRKPKNAYLYLP